MPAKNLRVIEIPGFDIEACGGTHVSNTGDIGSLLIIGSDRIKDGVNRVEIMAGRRAEEFLQQKKDDADNIMASMEGIGYAGFSKALKRLLSEPREAFRQLQRAGNVFNVSADQVRPTAERFAKDIKAVSSGPIDGKAASLEQACDHLFLAWKKANKEIEKKARELAGAHSEDLLTKAKGNRVAEILKISRSDLIKTAGMLIEKDNSLTVILAGENGDLVVMSKKEDAREILKRVCSMCGGAGGGRPDFAQGRTDPAKFREMKDKL